MKDQQLNPDQLAALYVEMTDDLAYARTHYPKSKNTEYLNNLALRVHQEIYKSKKEEKNRFLSFWFNEVPRAIFDCRKPLLVSLIIFIVSALIGVISMEMDEQFTRQILGDAYVNQTLINIDRDDPMAIYSSMRQTDMFFGITINNIRVSFLVFILGILTSYFPAALLVNNGVMLGAFQYFFYKKGLLSISAQAIWIHGTIEISSIIIAGGAGIALGNGLLFPGTLSRLQSLQKEAKKGLKVMLGLVPMFILAGILESFVTRYYKNTALSLTCIGLSIIWVLYYFVWLPYQKRNYEYLPYGTY